MCRTPPQSPNRCVATGAGAADGGFNASLGPMLTPLFVVCASAAWEPSPIASVARTATARAPPDVL